MLVRYLTDVSGGQYFGDAGDVRDLPDEVAGDWLAAGYAERVDPPSGELNVREPGGERAVAPPSGETPGRAPRGEHARRRK